MTFAFVCLAAVVTSFLLTAGVRRYAIGRSLLDIPGSRSSHKIPTPRGGGIAIVISFEAALVWLLSAGLLNSAVFTGLAAGGVIVAVVGFLDDHGHVAARWRLLSHFFASACVLLGVGGLPAIPWFGHEIDLGGFGYLPAILFLVWMLNLFNFMDGIDGIASVQAICVCGAAALLYLVTGHLDLVGPPLLLLCCVAGFLFWNFPPAKIFMGDAGSGFLGIMLGSLALIGGHADSLYFWAWLVLMGVFVVDATFTLLRRLFRGEKVYEAHRSHGYQFASRHYGRHLPVTAAVGVINALWLLPISLCIVKSWLSPLSGVVVAYLPLVGLAIRYHAGAADREASVDKGV